MYYPKTIASKVRALNPNFLSVFDILRSRRDRNILIEIFFVEMRQINYLETE